MTYSIVLDLVDDFSNALQALEDNGFVTMDSFARHFKNISTVSVNPKAGPFLAAPLTTPLPITGLITQMAVRLHTIADTLGIDDETVTLAWGKAIRESKAPILIKLKEAMGPEYKFEEFSP